MSAGSKLAAIGAQLKLCISFSLVFFSLCMLQQLCCLFQQWIHFFFPTVSMRLRPKRYSLYLSCFLDFLFYVFVCMFVDVLGAQADMGFMYFFAGLVLE